MLHVDTLSSKLTSNDWGSRLNRHAGNDGGTVGGDLGGRHSSAGGRRSLDLTVGDLGDGLGHNRCLRSSSGEAGEDDGSETHVDGVVGFVVGS